TPELVSLARGSSPGELKRELSGNLDRILLKAMDKRPGKRFLSVSDLSSYLHFHCERKTLEIEGSPVGQRISRFVGRNFTASILTAAVIIGLATGTIKVQTIVLILAGAVSGGIALAYLLMCWVDGRPKAPSLLKAFPAIFAATVLMIVLMV